MTEEPVLLNYVPSKSRISRRAVRRTLLALVVIASAVALWRIAPPIYRNLHLISLQGACASHTQSPDAVVFETEPQRAAELIKSGKCEAVYSHPGHNPPPGATSPAGYVNASWRDLYALLGEKSRPSDATLFLGLLQSPAGLQRLVCVDLSVFPHGDSKRPHKKLVYTRWCTVALGSTAKAASVETDFSDQLIDHGLDRRHYFAPPGVRMHTVELMGVSNTGLRYFAGQRDPRDKSRITILGEAFAPQGNKYGVRIDAQLMDDGKLQLNFTDFAYPKANTTRASNK